MRSSFAVRTGLLRLARTPNLREQASRRRLIAICAMLGLVLVSGVIGSLSATPGQAPPFPDQAGPFSYFPTQ